MAKLRHIAVATKDPEKTIEFYKKHFEMEVAGRIENDLAQGYYLTDGVVSLAILKFKIPNSNRSWDSENYTGIHHFGFIVEDMEKAARALEADGSELACDLLAVDEAYPAPVASESSRLRVHQAWRHGQVHLASYDGRLTLLVPGTSFSADLTLEAVARLAKALGASPSSFAVHLRLGG